MRGLSEGEKSAIVSSESNTQDVPVHKEIPMLARTNPRRIEKIANVLCSMPIPESGGGMDFHSSEKNGVRTYAADLFPGLGDSEAVNFFAFSCVQNHGFWYASDGRYESPITGHIRGKEYRGSALLFAALKQEFDRDRGIFEPYRLAHMSGVAIQHLLSDDLGPMPFPDIEARVALTHRYGAYFRAALSGLNSPKKMIEVANLAAQPLAALYRLFSWVPGFWEDPLQKKIGLFAMEMISRPERFLVPAEREDLRPIIDYHIMRVCLRSGMVLLAKVLRTANSARLFVTATIEEAIRRATYQAVHTLATIVRARLPRLRRVMAFVDHALWRARSYCPELVEPNCPSCDFRVACRKDTSLFQPVFRTLFY
ncbi:MAG: queuosine salvage family protein [bacterium]|nr:queuosine salvage family protein [bacterium]MDZ4284309.1 queuosine salvage family protein [Patescibacteria group bacterium]